MGLGSFWNRIRSLYRTVMPRSRPAPRPTSPVTRPQAPRAPVMPQAPQALPPPPVGPQDMATKMGLIAQAGRARKLLDIIYDGTQRFVEPYSFREKSTGRLFYGWCSIHDRIHSFRIEKIEKVSVTDMIFSPRWEVEF